MANMIIGHASRDENKKYSGGQAGDQDELEVCTRSYYLHSKGWYLLRPKNVTHANAIAEAMLRACNNNNIGYDQGNRLGIIKYGTNSTVKTECDCSSLVRQCVKEGTGVDAGNFTTATEKSMLLATGLFENAIAVTSSTVMYNGDILVTKTKGHTVIVVSGSARTFNSTSTSGASKTKITYISHRISDNKWGNEITDYNTTDTTGYSGVIGKEIDKIAIKLSEGTVIYSIHRTDGKWGGEITGYSTTDKKKYAGYTNRPIDAVIIKADGINGKLKYRVHRKTDNKWGNWITGYSKTDTNNYAGSFGKAIDAIQIGIE